MKTIQLFSSIAALLLASGANAQFFVYDGFETPGDYTNGTNVTTQTGGGSGDWNGAWTDVSAAPGEPFNTVTSSLSYSVGGNDLQTASGSLQKNSGDNTWLERDFNGDFSTTFSNTSNDLWFSVLIDMESSTDALFRVTKTSGNGPGFDINNGNLTAEYNGSTGAAHALAVDNTYLILGRVQQGTGGTNDVLDIWVDPASLESAPSTASDSSAAWDFGLDGAVAALVRSRNSSSLHADEIRIGTTFDSVTPFTAVPEPATCALFAGMLALTGVLIRRYRS